MRTFSNSLFPKIRFLLVGFSILSSFFSAFSQLAWKNVTDQFAPLPGSVQIFESTDSLEGQPNRSFYIKADLKDRSLDFTTEVLTGKRKTPTQYYEEGNQPLLVVNGTFFSFQTNSNVNVAITDGKLKAYNLSSVKGKNDSLFQYITRGAIGIRKNRTADVAWISTDSSRPFAMALQNKPSTLAGTLPDPDFDYMKANLSRANGIQKKWKMQTAIGGGPVLISQGKINITTKEERMFVGGEQDKHPRTAMGYTADDKLIILMVEGRNPGIAAGMTLKQEAETLRDLGCVEALNLDGGGSSCLLLNGKETIKPSDKEGQRPVPAVFLIRKK